MVQSLPPRRRDLSHSTDLCTVGRDPTTLLLSSSQCVWVCRSPPPAVCDTSRCVAAVTYLVIPDTLLRNIIVLLLHEGPKVPSYTNQTNLLRCLTVPPLRTIHLLVHLTTTRPTLPLTGPPPLNNEPPRIDRSRPFEYQSGNPGTLRDSVVRRVL